MSHVILSAGAGAPPGAMTPPASPPHTFGGAAAMNAGAGHPSAWTPGLRSFVNTQFQVMYSWILAWLAYPAESPLLPRYIANSSVEETNRIERLVRHAYDPARADFSVRQICEYVFAARQDQPPTKVDYLLDALKLLLPADRSLAPLLLDDRLVRGLLTPRFRDFGEALRYELRPEEFEGTTPDGSGLEDSDGDETEGGADFEDSDDDETEGVLNFVDHMTGGQRAEALGSIGEMDRLITDIIDGEYHFRKPENRARYGEEVLANSARNDPFLREWLY